MTEFVDPEVEAAPANSNSSSNAHAPRVTAPGLGAAQVILRPRKVRPFFGRHPWVLESAIARVEGDAADGDVVELISDKGKFVARGLYNTQSRIRVRLYTWSSAEAIDDAFWRRRLETAIALRRQLGYVDPNGAARIVFSEADGLSGLVVDRYGEYLAVQPTGLAIAKRLDRIVPMLIEMLRPRGVVLRNERGLGQIEGIHLTEGAHWGQMPNGPIFIEENGLRFGVDLREGQKTGFYLDQRENRRAAAAYCRGRRVLDLFCYSGGFGLAASKLGGANQVLAVDSSEKAIALARGKCRVERRGEYALSNRRRISDARRIGGCGRTLRRRRARPAQVCPQPRGGRRRLDGLSSAESHGRRTARAGRNLNHLQLLGPRHARRFLAHAGRRRPTNRPRYSNPRATRRGRRSSDRGKLLGERVFEVLHLPGSVKRPLGRHEKQPRFPQTLVARSVLNSGEFSYGFAPAR